MCFAHPGGADDVNDADGASGVDGVCANPGSADGVNNADDANGADDVNTVFGVFTNKTLGCMAAIFSAAHHRFEHFVFMV